VTSATVYATCPVCGGSTSLEWDRCGWCGAQRLLAHDGTYAGHRRVAGIGRRLLATAIDVLPFAALIGVILVAPDRAVTAGEPGEAGDAQVAEILSTLVVAFFIYLAVATGARARTLGKQLLNVHVVARDGAPVSYQRAAVREGVGKALELMILVPLGVASAASAGFDDRKRAVHDRLAGTVCVVGRPVPRPVPVDDDGSPAAPDQPAANSVPSAGGAPAS
jgi:uncharacterized RDD family membrane protein YckC